MATSSATLAQFFPKDAELGAQPSRITKFGGVPAIVFPKDYGANSPSPRVFFDCVIPGSATLGFSSTTGIQVKIAWSCPNQLVTGACRLAASFDLKGATDLPLANNSNFPADGGTNEVAGNSTVNATTAGGMNYLSLSLTLANIKNGQTTAVAINDFLRLQLRRAVENAGDTITGDIHIHSVQLVDY